MIIFSQEASKLLIRVSEKMVTMKCLPKQDTCKYKKKKKKSETKLTASVLKKDPKHTRV